MKTNEYNINDFYFHDQDGYKLNPKGMALICYYYRTKHNLNNLFAASNYLELENIIRTLLIQGSTQRFGVVYRNIPNHGIGFSHKCAVIVQGDEIIVLDPFGGYNGNINFARMGAEYIRFMFEKLGRSNIRIYTPKLRVQSDLSSCSTLCFLFLKEALRMGDELINFLRSANLLDEEDDLPPNLAKYTQKTSYLDNVKKNGLLNKYPNHHDYQIPIRSNKRQQETTKTTETLWQYVQSHQKYRPSEINPAATNRAAKHIKIINNYLDTLTLDELEKILQETSNPTEQLLLTINQLSSDNLIRTQPSIKEILPKYDVSEDSFDVFSFLNSDDEITKLYKPPSP